jgi:hypothetical protein
MFRKTGSIGIAGEQHIRFQLFRARVGRDQDRIAG